MLPLVLRVIILAIVLVGCARHTAEPQVSYYYPTQEDIAAADYGTYPSNYDQLIRDFLQSRLKDPSSAQYRYAGEPKKYHTPWGASPLAIDYYYLLTVHVNSKNSYGAYEGEHEYLFNIWNGEVNGFTDKTAEEEKTRKALEDIDRRLRRRGY